MRGGLIAGIIASGSKHIILVFTISQPCIYTVVIACLCCRPLGDEEKLEEELQSVRCMSFTVYAEECREVGVTVTWRTATMCRE